MASRCHGPAIRVICCLGWRCYLWSVVFPVGRNVSCLKANKETEGETRKRRVCFQDNRSCRASVRHCFCNACCIDRTRFTQQERRKQSHGRESTALYRR